MATKDQEGRHAHEACEVCGTAFARHEKGHLIYKSIPWRTGLDQPLGTRYLCEGCWRRAVGLDTPVVVVEPVVEDVFPVAALWPPAAVWAVLGVEPPVRLSEAVSSTVDEDGETWLIRVKVAGGGL